MRQMYERHFHSEMPNLKELVVDQIKPRLERLAKKNMPGLCPVAEIGCPLIGLAHGDLNAANIMIDALDTWSVDGDAVWLIDFATSVDLPLLTDLCKFEMACLFEYAILPITAENLVDLSGPDEAHWERMGIGEWLGVQQDVATSFLKLLLQKVKREKLASMEASQLESLVDEAIQQLPTHKQPQARRAILSRLTASQPTRSAQAEEWWFDKPREASAPLAPLGCDSLAMAAAAELGFARREMHSEKLAGTAPGTLPVVLDEAICKAKKEINGKVRISLVERAAAGQDGLVMLYPECLEYDIGKDGAGIPELLRFLKGELPRGSLGCDIEDTTLFVCAHTKRDGRCGFCGPRLTAKAEELSAAGKVGPMRIRKCSHVGGHKYAGNVLVYGKDQWHWYGYVSPENLLSVLRGKAERGRLWRGRLGITEDDALRERRNQVLRDSLPLAALATAAVLAAKTDCAFRYCESISKSMLSGDGLLETLRAEAPRIEGAGTDKFTGCGSLRFFVDIAKSIRRFMLREIQMCFRDFKIGMEDREPGELQVCDALSLQMWLPFLRESYRIVGYRDIPPQKKLWSIYHCKVVAENVKRTLEMLDSMDDLSPGSFEQLKMEDLTQGSFNLNRIYKNLKDEITNVNFRRSESVEVGTFTSEARKKEPFTEADSRWIHAHGELFGNEARHCRIVQCVHAECDVYSNRPGLFAPIFQVVVKGQKAKLHFGEDKPPQPGDQNMLVPQGIDAGGKRHGKNVAR
ncbi:unnamed protein product [Cladocopium goreaui]|uniref:Ternary complex associated domain-containing protein n=1 Tax=Cladocopium goreaui TaxID=2562237 RepID=A0A9P1CSD7_9DINO|nr:unnamed protein product [Cladocopium goreaui]